MNKSDLELLQQIMELFYKYCPDAFLTIEVREDDYLRCQNLSNTLKSLEIVNKNRVQ